MARTCRGVCVYICQTGVPNKFKYEVGLKRCTFCAIYLETSSHRCPCCSAVLRTKSRRTRRRVVA